MWRWLLLLIHLFHLMWYLVPSSRANPGGIKKNPKLLCCGEQHSTRVNTVFCKWIIEFTNFLLDWISWLKICTLPALTRQLAVIPFEHVRLWPNTMGYIPTISINLYFIAAPIYQHALLWLDYLVRKYMHVNECKKFV